MFDKADELIALVIRGKMEQAGYETRFIRPEFWSWIIDPANRPVIDRFVEYARQMKQSGRPRYSHRCIAHRVRWDTALHDSSKDFKINNNVLAGLARYVMTFNPDLRGFLQVRDQKAWDD